MRHLVTLTALCVFVVGCSRGYEGENRSLAEELPTLDGVVMLEEDHYDYCSRDSCPFGDDRSGVLLSYTVEATMFDQRSLVEAYHDELAGWDLSMIEGPCGADEDPVLCDQIISATFTRGDEQISLNLDNWAVGWFDIHVDARSGESRQ